MTVLAAHAWPSNAELIADVAKLGYLDGRVLDVTYGMGTFWKLWRPANFWDFWASDLLVERSPTGFSVDFTNMMLVWDRSFDAIVLDPPYKLNGTPDEAVDGRYGVHEGTSDPQGRIDLMLAGVTECSHYLTRRGHLLVKCQDQVCSGRMWWQTDLVTERATACGLRKIDRFDLLGNHRPQPMQGRTQKHAHGRPSTLLVFRRTS